MAVILSLLVPVVIVLQDVKLSPIRVRFSMSQIEGKRTQELMEVEVSELND